MISSKRTIIVIFAMLTTITFVMTACKEEPQKAALPFIAADNDELGCVELSRDGIIYRPYGVVGDKSMRGDKIGVRGGDSSSIFEVKGYDSSEWVLESDSGFMSAGDMLYKAVGIQEIPAKLKKYKEYDY